MTNEKLKPILDMLHAEQWSIALEQLEILWQENLGDADIARLAAYAAAAKDHYEQAISYLKVACQKQPRADLYLALGNLFRKLPQDAQAQESYQQALLLQPDLYEGYFNLAQVYLKQENYQQALEPLKKWLSQYPKHLPAIFQLATAYFQLGNFQDAKKQFIEVLKYNEHHVEALCNYGVCCLKNNDFQTAIHSFSTAIRVDETHLPSFSNLAAALLQEERFQEAKDQYWQYLKLAPDDLEARYNYGVCLMMLGEIAEAENIFNSIIEIIPEHINAYHNLAAMALKKKQAQIAIEHYQKISQYQPSDEIAQYMLSALSQKQNIQKAPSTYIKNLFDNYAKHFDQHLQSELHYQTPALLKNLVTDTLKKKNKFFINTILDLGCGTGLSGEAFRDLSASMIGVDLSRKMLAEAKKKNIYQELIEADIDNFLLTENKKFDLIIAADVLVYYGNLNKLFNLIKNSLSPQGLFTFSVEKSSCEEFGLTPSGRYQHHKDYLIQVCKEASFEMLSCQKSNLRKQDGYNVKGYIVLVKTSQF